MRSPLFHLLRLLHLVLPHTFNPLPYLSLPFRQPFLALMRQLELPTFSPPTEAAASAASSQSFLLQSLSLLALRLLFWKKAPSCCLRFSSQVRDAAPLHNQRLSSLDSTCDSFDNSMSSSDSSSVKLCCLMFVVFSLIFITHALFVISF